MNLPLDCCLLIASKCTSAALYRLVRTSKYWRSVIRLFLNQFRLFTLRGIRNIPIANPNIINLVIADQYHSLLQSHYITAFMPLFTYPKVQNAYHVHHYMGIPNKLTDRCFVSVSNEDPKIMIIGFKIKEVFYSIKCWNNGMGYKKYAVMFDGSQLINSLYNGKEYVTNSIFTLEYLDIQKKYPFWILKRFDRITSDSPVDHAIVSCGWYLSDTNIGQVIIDGNNCYLKDHLLLSYRSLQIKNGTYLLLHGTVSGMTFTKRIIDMGNNYKKHRINYDGPCTMEGLEERVIAEIKECLEHFDRELQMNLGSQTMK